MSDQPGAIGGLVDPYRNYNFKLDIRGVTEGHFTECSGLGVRVRTIRYREAGTGQVVRAIPGAVEYADVTLRYGLTQSRDLWDWMMRAASGRVERRHVSIVVLDPDGATEALRWNLSNAFPCEWSCPAFEALGRDVAVETLRLAYDTLERG
jgi:phage tail-like protein